MRRHRRAATSVVAVSVAAVTIVSLASVYDGAASAQVDLNDGGVWVTKQSSLQVAHVNRDAGLIDGAAYADGENFDVLQSGGRVIVTAPGTASALDPVLFTLGGQTTIPAAAEVLLGGDTVAVHDRDGGRLWVMPAADLAGFTDSAGPIATLRDGAAVVVGRDGTVHAVSPLDDLLLTVRTDAGRPAEPQSQSFALPDDTAVSITAVGDVAVVLDSVTGELRTADTVLTTISDSAARLQQPSDEADAVAVTTSSELIQVPMTGGDEETTTATPNAGGPVAPVSLGGCVYAVWEGTAAFIRDCAGSSSDLASTVDDAAADATFVFRVNREVVMLNDVADGVSWLVDGTLTKVDNWSEIRPPDGDVDQQGDSSQLTFETTQAVRSAENTPPTAMDDEFGVRAGRSTVLAVTDNDSDPDGDVLTISLEGSQPSWGTVRPVLDGQALQITVDDDQVGETSFEYTVSDGRDGEATARVNVAVHGDDVQTQPEQRRTAVIPVEVGGTVTYTSLPDWHDPDGDDLYLQAATTESADDVRFTPDGRVTFTAAAGVMGVVEVQLVVSDGTKTQVGKLRFDVRAPGSVTPVTLPDHVTFRAGGSATVRPLSNDVSGSIVPLALSSVGEAAGVEVVPDFDGGSIQLSSATVGTSYLTYRATAGGDPADGVIRIDVTDPAAPAAAPIAVRDIVMIASGGDVQVPVLENDVDPSGGVLVVQGLTVDPSSGLSASVAGNATVRVTAPGGLSGPQRIGYRVSNGQSSSTGDIIVIPIAPSTVQLPPVATDDSLTVRTADVGTVDVLANDASPVGSKLTLVPELVMPLDATLGEAFVADGRLRVRTNATAGSGVITYRITDENGQSATADVMVSITEDRGDNVAPKPRDIEARTIAGRVVSVTVNLDGIDPDGDSVELLSLDSAPTMGIVQDMADRSFTYQAGTAASGTDVFRYRVRDRLGAEAVGTVRIGIAPADALNQAPFAVTDTISIRPGREVDLDVINNDSDPDVDAISLVADSLIVPDMAGLRAVTMSNRSVSITAPEEPGQYAFQYVAEDARGSRAVGTVQLLVDPNVPLMPPRAVDDRVATADIDDDGVAIVDVLANDADPDGTAEALTIALVGETTATVTADRTVRVEVTSSRQLIEYSITDDEGGIGRAFIFVPALDDLRPVMIAGQGTVEVRSGESIAIALTDHVRVVGAGEPTLGDSLTPTALHSNGASLRRDAATLVYTSAAGYIGDDAITFAAVAGTGDAQRTAVLSIAVSVIGADQDPENPQPPQGPGSPEAPDEAGNPDDPNNPDDGTKDSDQPGASDFAVNGTRISVVPGGDAQTQSMRALTTGPDQATVDAAAYRIVGGVPHGIEATISGSELTVTATTGTDLGPTAGITVKASSGKHTSTATVDIVVVSSTLPMPVAAPDSAETEAGKPVTIEVTRNDINPYAGTSPLTVIDAKIAAGTAQLSRDGNRVTITPSADSTGQVTATYRIADASGDAAREVEGTITVRITGQKPSAPGTPRIGAVSSRSVALSWSAPASTGGSPISEYRVRTNSGALVATCTVPACTVTGLTDGTAYTFTVTAVNAVGESAPSAPSLQATPADRPDTPHSFFTTPSDSKATVAWIPSTGATTYNVKIDPVPKGSRPTDQVNDPTITWHGLTNGVAYRFQVQAVAGSVTSDWSVWTTAVTPAKEPDGTGAPRVTRLSATGGENRFRVVWDAPQNDGGSPVTGYELKLYSGTSSRDVPVNGTATSVDVLSAAHETDVQFTVASTNTYGTSLTSARSAAVRVVRAPGAPGKPALTASGGNVRVASYDAAKPNGARPDEISTEYSANNGEWQSLPSSGTFPAPNTATTTVRLRAVVNVDGLSLAGPASPPSDPITPFASLTPPVVTEVSAGAGWINWSWDVPNAGAQNVVSVQYSVNGGEWNTAPVSGSKREDVPAGKVTEVRMRSVTALSTYSDVVTEPILVG